MKNTKIMNKHIILGAALLTAVLILTGCNHDTAVNNEPVEQEKQSILVGGTFAIDGALPKELAALSSNTGDESGRAASTLFPGLNSQNYECIVEGYTLVYPVSDKPNPNDQPEKNLCSTGNVDFANKTWNILLPLNGTYLIEIKLIKKRSNPQDTYAETDVILANALKNLQIKPAPVMLEYYLRGHVPYPIDAPVMLVPNKDYAEESNAQKLNLKFCLPASCDVGEIQGALVTADRNPLSLNFSVTEFSTSGDYKIATLTANYDGSDIINGSFSGKITFLDSLGNVIYIRNEAINIIPGFITDTWTGEEPFYYIDSQTGDTYFNVTQEMIDDFAENAALDQTYLTIASDGYPVVLFDKSNEGGYSVFDTVSENAELSDGLSFGDKDKIVDFTFAPIVYTHSATTQVIYTIEKDALGRAVNLVKYPNFTGYNKGQFIACLNNNTDDAYYEVISFYADEDGFIYYLLVKKASATSTQITDMQIKRIYVKENTGSSFGKIETLVFRSTTGKNYEEWSYAKAIYGADDFSIGSNIKIAKFNNYLYLFHVYNDSNLGGVVFDCTQISLYSSGTSMYFYVSGCNGSIYHLKKTISDTVKYTSVEGDTSKIDSFILNELYGKCTINDLMIMPTSSGSDADLYALVSTNWKTEIAPYGFGGIIKISSIKSKLKSNWASHSFDQIGGTTGPFIRGWISSNPPNYPESEQYFYCPTKFVARKPDELVIADEVCYQYNSSVNDTDRVVVINDLSNFATGSGFASATTVKTNFSTYLYYNSSCGYVYAKYGEENNN